jgi:hypothetical protein
MPVQVVGRHTLPYYLRRRDAILFTGGLMMLGERRRQCLSHAILTP